MWCKIISLISEGPLELFVSILESMLFVVQHYFFCAEAIALLASLFSLFKIYVRKYWISN
jgi:hypothetical protein